MVVRLIKCEVVHFLSFNGVLLAPFKKKSVLLAVSVVIVGLCACVSLVCIGSYIKLTVIWG